MNDFELESKLKSVPLPERSEDYWGNFPLQVRMNLRRAPVEFTPQNPWLPRLAWAGGGAMACLIACLFFGFEFGQPPRTVSRALWQEARTFHKELVRLPSVARVIMQDEHGLHYLIAELD